MGVVLCRFDAKSVSAGILGSGHTAGKHLCPIDPKSAVAWLTAGESAVVCLVFAQTEGKWQ